MRYKLVVRNQATQDLRQQANYIFFYRIQHTTVEILRVFHGARDLTDLFSELDEDF